MHKRLLIGLAGAGIVGGASFGFAATLGVTTADLGAGQQLVASCDSTVDADYTAEWDAGNELYEVNVVTVSGVAEACAGDDMRVALAKADGTLIAEVTTAVAGIASTSESFDFTSQSVSAKDVEQIHIVISGE